MTEKTIMYEDLKKIANEIHEFELEYQQDSEVHLPIQIIMDDGRRFNVEVTEIQMYDCPYECGEKHEAKGECERHGLPTVYCDKNEIWLDIN